MDNAYHFNVFTAHYCTVRTGFLQGAVLVADSRPPPIYNRSGKLNGYANFLVFEFILYYNMHKEDAGRKMYGISENQFPRLSVTFSWSSWNILFYPGN